MWFFQPGVRIKSTEGTGGEEGMALTAKEMEEEWWEKQKRSQDGVSGAKERNLPEGRGLMEQDAAEWSPGRVAEAGMDRQGPSPMCT